jgi:hypothetical protein
MQHGLQYLIKKNDALWADALPKNTCTRFVATKSLALDFLVQPQLQLAGKKHTGWGRRSGIVWIKSVEDYHVLSDFESAW